MATSTIQLQRTINLTQQFLRYAPLTFLANGGMAATDDPAFSNADWVKQFILSPSLGGWRWNRKSSSPSVPTFTTVPGQTDYTVSLPDFGWIEKAVAYDPNNGFASYELQNELVKGADLQSNQPTRISAQESDDSGNVTFRVFPAPDAVYNIVVIYQVAAALFTDVTNTWAPIPDYLSYIFNEGFAAKAYEYSNDPRFPAAMQLFLQHLADAAEGLDSTQRNLWLADKLNTLRETARVQAGRA